MLLKWAKQHGAAVLLNKKLENIASESDAPPSEILETEADAVKACDIVIAIGGDGTILWTTRLVLDTGVQNKPILGVNSGRLGFMANIHQNSLVVALNHILNGTYDIDRRHLLKATDEQGNEYRALNEFLFSKAQGSSMVKLEVEYDDRFVNRYWSDGLIVASPTGSSAYNLSAGGPIVHPETNVMVVTPISPHMLTTRPLVLPADKILRVTVQEDPGKVMFSYDGENCELCGCPEVVEIRRSQFCIELIQLPGQNYFNTLRTKLMWGVDVRDHDAQS